MQIQHGNKLFKMTKPGPSPSNRRNSLKRLSNDSGFVYCGNWSSDSEGDNSASSSGGDDQHQYQHHHHDTTSIQMHEPSQKSCGFRKNLRKSHRQSASSDNILVQELRRNSSQFFRKTRKGVIGRIQFAAKIRVLTKNEAMDVTASAVYSALMHERDGSDDGSVDIAASCHRVINHSRLSIDEEMGVLGKAASPQFTENFPKSTKVGPHSVDDNDASFVDAREEDFEEGDSVGLGGQQNIIDLGINTPTERLTICLEIEKCDLKIRRRFVSFNPFVIIKLNGREIARTPALRSTNQPVWQDEIFEFPACTNCGNLTFEVWDIKPFSLVAKDCFGIASLAVQEMRNLYTNENNDEFLEFDLDLRDRKKIEDGSWDSCICPLLDGETNLLCSQKTRNKVYHNYLPNNWLRVMKRIGTTQGEQIVTPTNMNANAYKVENRDPYRRQELRECKDKKNNPPWYKSSTTKALAMVGCYMLIGIAAFSFIFEKKTIQHSLYLGVVTFTTVGYGDVVPQTRGSKIFCCFFALLGIGIIGIALGYVGQHLVQLQLVALKKKAEERTDGLRQSLVPSDISTPKWKAILVFVSPFTIMITVGAVFVGHFEKWDVVDSIYWCIMTGTSVGYGDIHPTKPETMWFSIIFIPLAAIVVSNTLGQIANIFIEREIKKANTKLLKREVTLEDLEAMNADGNGEVSPLEFVEHMLLVMQKVDRDLLEKLHVQFERLDADGSGGLQPDDLEILTKERLHERRQNALREYNQSILPVTLSQDPS